MMNKGTSSQSILDDVDVQHVAQTFYRDGYNDAVKKSYMCLEKVLPQIIAMPNGMLDMIENRFRKAMEEQQ